MQLNRSYIEVTVEFFHSLAEECSTVSISAQDPGPT